eukprot:CAMPEP_0171371682 /NCGR_PEP_ID=MMETSP0879-20121228/8796_1 /TAXON_ID=67004 /ORGANISM="Thalassiosira weissflogii, Strain CCMP1336" /LENGTH=397 /DNA_ID=CAMNT_0011880317 /DNA_START=7 /DNA_END=1197 /DNA_ORIENTATION=+
MAELTATQRRRQRRKRNKGVANANDGSEADTNVDKSKETAESPDSTGSTMEPSFSRNNDSKTIYDDNSTPTSEDNLESDEAALDEEVSKMSINEVCQALNAALNNSNKNNSRSYQDTGKTAPQSLGAIKPPIYTNTISQAVIDVAAFKARQKDKSSQLQQDQHQKNMSLEDYFNLPHEEFNRLWKRSLRFLKKASESFDKSPQRYGRHDRGNSNNNRGISSGNLTFHNKVYEDIQTNHIVYFDFFLSIERDYKSNGQEPNFDIAEQVIIVLSTLADSKPWKVPGGAGAMSEDVSDILMWAQQFLVRLQSLTNMYGGNEQKNRTSTVTHTLMKQVLNFHSPRGVSADMISYEAIGAFRMCAELELKNYVDSGEILSWIPPKQRVTVGKLREMPDEKIW